MELLDMYSNWGDYIKALDPEPRTRDPKTGNPKTWDLRTHSLEGCVALQQLQHNYTGNLCQCNKPKTHRVITMHTKGIIYSRQRTIKLPSDFFDPQSSVLSCKA